MLDMRFHRYKIVFDNTPLICGWTRPGLQRTPNWKIPHLLLERRWSGNLQKGLCPGTGGVVIASEIQFQRYVQKTFFAYCADIGYFITKNSET